jgi:hypothetical protein
MPYMSIERSIMLSILFSGVVGCFHYLAFLWGFYIVFNCHFKVAGLPAITIYRQTRKDLRLAVLDHLENSGREPDELEWAFVSVVEADELETIINWLE